MDRETFLRYLHGAVMHDASDIHFKPGSPPVLRVAKQLRPSRAEPLTPDDTRDMVAQRYGSDPRVKYFRNEQNLHAGRSRQRGYQLAAGEFIIFLDDDDFYVDPNFISLAMEEHIRNPSLSFVCANGLVYHVSQQKVEIGSLSFTGTIDSKEYLERFQLGYKKPYSTFPAVFRKSILDQADLAHMEMMNDGPICLRALLFGQVCSLPQASICRCVENDARP